MLPSVQKDAVAAINCNVQGDMSVVSRHNRISNKGSVRSSNSVHVGCVSVERARRNEFPRQSR